MKRLARLAVAAAVAASLAAPAALAHGTWFMQRANQTAMIFGVGGDDLDMVKRLPKVSGFKAFDADQKEVPAKLEAAGPLVVVVSEAKPPIVSAWMDYGVWTKTKDGKWHSKGMDEVPDAIVAEHTYKYAVHVRGDLNGPLGPLEGQRLQIIPVAKKLPEKMGAPLKLKVMFDGKPAKGAKILTDFVNDPDAKPLVTAADGTVTIKVRNQGPNVIAAILVTKPAEPAKTKIDEHLATLSFILPHLPE